ncbi:MAG: hypothetical protein WC292_03415 [Clostridia bacterium]
MNKHHNIQAKRQQFFARGLGQIELATSPYTTEFIEAQRLINKRRQPLNEQPKTAAVILQSFSKTYRRRRIFLLVVLLSAILSLLVFALDGVLVENLSLFTKSNGALITVSDPLLGGLNKFFGTKYSSQFYSDCLKYVENTHPLTAISFYFLPLMIAFAALNSAFLIIFVVVALLKKPDANGCVSRVPPLWVLFVLQFLCVIVIVLSGVLWNSAGAGEVALFFLGGSSFLSAGGGLFMLIAAAVIAPISFVAAYKKVNLL